MIGSPWRFVQRESKQTDPDYIALWWNTDWYALQDGRKDGYKVQKCYMEVGMDDELVAAIGNKLYEVKIGARFYDDDNATDFVSMPEQEFDWYLPGMSFSSDLEKEPVYAEEAQIPQTQEQKTYEIDICTIFGIAPEDCVINDVSDDVVTEGDSGDSSDNVVSLSKAVDFAPAVRQEAEGEGEVVENTETASETPSGNQYMYNGFMLYEEQVESDFWWFSFFLELPNMVVSDGNVIYQFVTLTDTADDPDAPWTLSCSVTIGDDTNTYTIQEYYEQVTGEELLSDSDVVVGVDYTSQAPDFIEDDINMQFTGSDAQVGVKSLDATSDSNTVYPCFAYKELPKIGRNPYDFDKTYSIELGARVYSDASATDFTEIPTNTDSLYLPEPPSYSEFVVIPTGASTMLTSLATLALMLAALAL